MKGDVYVHPTALCESERVGDGTRVWAFAHVLPGAIIGRNCNLCDHTFVDTGAVVGNSVTVKNGIAIWDKVVIEDNVFLGPNVAFTNDMRPRAALKKDPSEFLATLVERGATVGANATIICGVRIGRSAFVAAGATVTKDVPSHALVMGTPARRMGWVCECGQTLPGDLACECGRRYQLDLGAGGLSAIAARADGPA